MIIGKGDMVEVIVNEDSNYIRKGAYGTIIGEKSTEFLIKYIKLGDGEGGTIDLDPNDEYKSKYFTEKHRLRRKQILNWRKRLEK